MMDIGLGRSFSKQSTVLNIQWVYKNIREKNTRVDPIAIGLVKLRSQ